MNLTEITPVVLSFDEEPNIARTLQGLSWAQRIVVLDSGSTDGTAAICRSNPKVEFFTRSFDCHSEQWNAALDLACTPWVLTLDADYYVTEELVLEIEALPDEPEFAGYQVSLAFCVRGRPLRGSLLPPRICLFRLECGRYRQDGHTQELALNGRCGVLVEPILHDDRKPFARWWRSQKKYAELEVKKLAVSRWSELSPQDRLRKWTPFAPFAVAAFCLLRKGLVFDFPRGWIYTLHRVLVEFLLLWRLLVFAVARTRRDVRSG